jgi:hypothetical protein
MKRTDAIRVIPHTASTPAGVASTAENPSPIICHAFSIMNKIVSIVLLVGGIGLIIYGISASDSLGSSFSRFFTGSPTDKSMWLLIGGTAAGVAGLVGLLRGSKSA